MTDIFSFQGSCYVAEWKSPRKTERLQHKPNTLELDPTGLHSWLAKQEQIPPTEFGLDT